MRHRPLSFAFGLALLGCSNGAEPSAFNVSGSWEAEGYVAASPACGFFVSDIILTGTTDAYSGSGMLTRPGYLNKIPVSIEGTTTSVVVGPLQLRTGRRTEKLLTGTFMCDETSGEWSMYTYGP